MTLEQIIIQEIRRNGNISFRTFMEMALYQPGLGYYMSDREKIGPRGDFVTSCSYTSVFGKLLAKQLEEMAETINAPCFTIVEYGAGTGVLCRDILCQLKKNPSLYDRLHYCIIEKSDYMRQREKEILNEKVSWHDSIKELGHFSGCVLSNELVDNFSVHQVIMLEELMEVFVGYENGFVEILKPAPNILTDYFRALNVKLPTGFRAEINLEVIRWTEDIAATLDKGYVLTIDYGYPSSQLYTEKHSQGTLICYHQHRINYCPYSNIGGQDITSHVNFSALHHWGNTNGLQLNGFTTQACFLMGLGFSNQLAKIKPDINTMIHLENFMLDLGKKLKVLIQQKGMGDNHLRGLRFPQRLT